MGFFRDMKAVIGSTVNAVGHGINLAAELAAETERLADEANEAVKAYSKRIQVERLEDEIRRSVFCSTAQEAEKKQALLIGYDGFDPSCRTERAFGFKEARRTRT